MAPTIAIESPDQPEIRAMLEESDAVYAEDYPAESNHLLGVESLTEADVTFFVARVDGAIRGFGAVVDQGDGWGEIKRMYVDPAARGLGLGRLILSALEDHARGSGFKALRLETGVDQSGAHGLYRGAGYAEIGPFGEYTLDRHSIFMEKTLTR